MSKGWFDEENYWDWVCGLAGSFGGPGGIGGADCGESAVVVPASPTAAFGFDS